MQPEVHILINVKGTGMKIKALCLSQLQALTSPGTRGHLTKNHARGGRGICPHKMSRGQDLTGAGKFQKFNIQGFFGIHTEYETEFAFSFKNSEVSSYAL